MSFRSLLSQTVTVVHRASGTVDSEGNVTPGTATTTDHPGRVEETDSVEVLQGEVRTLSNWRVFLLPDVPLVTDDEVVVDGQRYQVVGLPAILQTPRGPHHIEAHLRSVGA